MISNKLARRVAERWRKEHGGYSWPAKNIYSRPLKILENGCKIVLLGYDSDRGFFWVIKLFIPSDQQESIKVIDRRQTGIKWAPPKTPK